MWSSRPKVGGQWRTQACRLAAVTSSRWMSTGVISDGRSGLMRPIWRNSSPSSTTSRKCVVEGGRRRAKRSPCIGSELCSILSSTSITFCVSSSNMRHWRRDRRLRSWIVVIGATSTALWLSPVTASQPPSDGCRAASKIEYDSAKKTYLLQNRFGMYVRSGRIWRRHYWYCHYSFHCEQRVICADGKVI